MNLNNLKIEHCNALVQITYSTILNRDADDNGLKYFSQKLLSNSNISDILNEIYLSDEFKKKYQPIIVNKKPSIDVSVLTPRAQDIYNELKEAIKRKKGKL